YSSGVEGSTSTVCMLPFTFNVRMLIIHFPLAIGSFARCRWLPRGSAVFPLVIGELLDTGAVVPHNEQFPIGLRRIRVHDLVFEAHPRAGECDVLSIRRPRHMRVIAP